MSGLGPVVRAVVDAGRRRDARGGQGGYLLIYVLGIIGLTSVLVIALLGLALTSARVASMEARLARETRAADGAIEAQIAAISSRGGAICDNSFPAQVADPSVEGGVVTVECTTSGVANPGQMLPGPDVQVVGASNYAGGLTPSMSGVTDPNLVVNATDGPAQFDSDVLVTRGAAVNRTSGTPAVSVAGQYQQGSSLGGSGCGALATDATHRIGDEGGTGEPSCGTAPSIVPATPKDVAGILRPTTGRDFSCPPGGSITLAAGAYSTADVHALNQLVSSPSTTSCTIVFDVGLHYLDVFDPAKAAGSRNLLEISNPNIRIIGGVPVPSATGAVFPNACQNGESDRGVQIILSPRSAIRHTAGRVALCAEHVVSPGGASGALPVLVQSDSTNSQPQLVGTSATGFINPAGLASTTSWAEATLCGWEFNWTWGLYVVCAERSFSTTWSSSGAGPLTSARVLLDMRQRPVPVTGVADTAASYHNAMVDVRFTVSNGATSCVTDWQPAGRSWAQTMSYDLIGSADCRSKFTQQDQINGATVGATFRAPSSGTGLLISARNMRIETNAQTLSASSTGASDAQWAGVGGAANGSDSNASASVSQVPVTWPVAVPVTYWEDAARITRSFTLTNFSLPSGLLPTDQVNRLGVLVRGPSNEPSFLADPADGGKMVATLTTSDGSTCTAESQSYGQSSGYVRYDLITGSCASKVISADQLQNAQLRLSITTGCTNPQAPGAPAGKCSSVGIPKVDHLALSVGTDSFHGTTPYSTVTANPAGGTSFDVFGSVLLPSTDLDVVWAGSAEPSRPLFDGPLQVHGLGVEQKTGAAQGTVCCVIDDTAAVLVATVGGNLRGQAAISVDRGTLGTVAARREVEIMSWQLCGRTGC